VIRLPNNTRVRDTNGPTLTGKVIGYEGEWVVVEWDSGQPPVTLTPYWQLEPLT
jgi:hypothetical protein